MPPMTDRTVLGLTINPEFVQCEGLEKVIGNAVGRLRARVVATTPSVMEPSDDTTGGREPPLDAGAGKDRLLDRALWGRRWLNVRSAPSFAPRRALYEGLAFQPPEPDRLTDTEGPKVAAFLAELKRQGVETHMQIMAAAPPCYRVQSRGTAPDAEPLTATGKTVVPRVDANLSLAHPDLRGYVAALVCDLVENYPDMDVIRFDWPEYPPYHPDSLSFDFSSHAVQRGQSLGFDVQRLRARLVECIPKLKTLVLERSAANAAAEFNLEDPQSTEAMLPAVGELIRYRRALVVDYAGFLAGSVRDASNGRVGCFLQCFPPPLNVLSGFSIGEIDPMVSGIGVKLYTMHWPMIERAYVERLLDFAGGDPEPHLAAVRALFGTSPPGSGDLSSAVYPRPDQPHPATDGLIEGKIRTAAAEASHANLWGLTHGYGPVADVVRRFRAVHRAAGGKVHINRYGYLGEDKITALENALS